MHYPYRKDLKEKAKQNRNNPSEPESKIWFKLLSNRQMKSYRFVRQKPLGNYIVDFYCPRLNLVLEIDGDSHAEQETYDKNRTNYFKKFGLMVIRYTNTEVMEQLDSVYNDLLAKIEKREQEIKSARERKSPFPHPV